MDDDQRRSAVRRAVIAFVAAGILLLINLVAVGPLRDDRGDRLDRLDAVREECRDGNGCRRWGADGDRSGSASGERGPGPVAGRPGPGAGLPGGPDRQGPWSGRDSDDADGSDRGGSDDPGTGTRPGSTTTTTPATTAPAAGGI